MRHLRCHTSRQKPRQVRGPRSRRGSARLFATLALSAATLAASPHPAALASPADDALLHLLQADLDLQRKTSPVYASVVGDRRFDRSLGDPSPEATRAYFAESRARLQALAALDRASLSEENRLNADLLEHVLRERLAAEPFHFEQQPITQQDGLHLTLPQIPDTVAFTTDKHLEDYVERLTATGPYIDGLITNMRAGLAAGRTPPKIVMGSVPGQVGALTHSSFVIDPRTHPMHRPFASRAPGDPLAARAESAIQTSVVPAFIRLRDFLRDEYVPNCRAAVAASEGPDGLALYEYLIRLHTTTDLTAQEIHDLGKREVARLRAEMLEVIARSDFPRKDEFSGDELFAAFLDYLRNDSRFYHESPEALLTGYREICKLMDAELPRLFGKLPRLSYGVREMPRFMAPSAPTAYYYPGSLKSGSSGTFIANTYRLDQRPKYEMRALAFHEAVPGHHLQIALAQELEMEGMPEWRAHLDFTVFVEGWALYSERLGLEVGGPPGSHGLYADPYDDFGRLTYEMWRALRLVVDTGIHALGWTREQAIEYMKANSALSEANIVSEVDRYIAMPGQALAYKIGELRITDLRRRAEEALGEDFDVRAFHDHLLGAGALPIGVMEKRMVQWIEAQK